VTQRDGSYTRSATRGPLDVSGEALAVCDMITLGVYREILEILSGCKDPLGRVLCAQVKAEAMLSPAFLRTMVRLMPRAQSFASALDAARGRS
jgi:hypothetical protein